MLSVPRENIHTLSKKNRTETVGINVQKNLFINRIYCMLLIINRE